MPNYGDGTGTKDGNRVTPVAAEKRQGSVPGWAPHHVEGTLANTREVSKNDPQKAGVERRP